MSIEKNECLDDEIAFLLLKFQRKNMERKKFWKQNRDIENLQKFWTFEEIEDEGKDKITSRWVILKRLKHDGQKEEYKARLLIRGLQEMDDLQSDIPTALRESAKLFYSIAANEGFNCRSIDIRTTFL